MRGSCSLLSRPLIVSWRGIRATAIGPLLHRGATGTNCLMPRRTLRAWRLCTPWRSGLRACVGRPPFSSASCSSASRCCRSKSATEYAGLNSSGSTPLVENTPAASARDAPAALHRGCPLLCFGDAHVFTPNTRYVSAVRGQSSGVTAHWRWSSQPARRIVGEAAQLANCRLGRMLEVSVSQDRAR